jgi:hypothetical protein
MPTITRFEEIEAWQTARELTNFISYLETHPQSHRLKEDAPEYEV